MNFESFLNPVISVFVLIVLIFAFTGSFNIQSLKKSLLEVTETILVAVLVLLTVYVTIAFPVEVSGSSMFPNLETGDRLLVEKITRYIEGYKRGEIVVLHPPENDYIDYVKRIVGIPGDTVKIYNCQVFISRDDSKFILDESLYLDSTICTVGGKNIVDGRVYTLSSDEFLVLGDNRTNSQDSRFFGILKEDRIQGKVVARFWPPAKVNIY